MEDITLSVDVTKAILSSDHKSSILVQIFSFPTRKTRIFLSSKTILEGLAGWWPVSLIEIIYYQVSSFKYARGGEVSGILLKKIKKTLDFNESKIVTT